MIREMHDEMHDGGCVEVVAARAVGRLGRGAILMAAVGSVGGAGGGATAVADDPAAAATRELGQKSAGWLETIGDSLRSPDAQQQVVDGLKTAVQDPEQRRMLAENGIDQGVIDRAQADIDNPDGFDAAPWSAIAKGASALSEGEMGEKGIGVKGLLADAMVKEATFGTFLLAERNLLGQMDDLKSTRASIAERADSAREKDEPVTVTAAEIDKLKDSGFTAEDTDDAKLKAALRSDKPADAVLSVKEADGVLQELEKKESGMEGDAQERGLKLQELASEYKQAFELASSVLKEVTDSKKKSIDAIGVTG